MIKKINLNWRYVLMTFMLAVLVLPIFVPPDTATAAKKADCNGLHTANDCKKDMEQCNTAQVIAPGKRAECRENALLRAKKADAQHNLNQFKKSCRNLVQQPPPSQITTTACNSYVSKLRKDPPKCGTRAQSQNRPSVYISSCQDKVDNMKTSVSAGGGGGGGAGGGGGGGASNPLNKVTQATNCPAEGNRNNCLTNLPQVRADRESDRGQISTILSIVFGIAAGVALISLMIASFNYATAGTDIEKIGRSKRAIIFALTGLVIALSAEALVLTILGEL